MTSPLHEAPKRHSLHFVPVIVLAILAIIAFLIHGLLSGPTLPGPIGELFTTRFF